MFCELTDAFITGLLANEIKCNPISSHKTSLSFKKCALHGLKTES